VWRLPADELEGQDVPDGSKVGSVAGDQVSANTTGGEDDQHIEVDLPL
jgi:hypothetical protein